MASNVVEGVLRSKYEDGIDKGVEQTRAAMERSLAMMHDAAGAAGAGIEAAFESVAGSLEDWRQKLSKAADESDSSFKKMGLGAAAFGVAAAEIFLRAAKAAADFVFDLIKESSEVAEVRINFEALTAAQGMNADMMLGKLKQATDGQIGQLTLLRNANKVLTGDLPLTGEQYIQLSENIMRLSKSAGTDAVAAQDALTTSLIRGMSRGLGPAIGIHLAVKDAVAAMTEEMNISADAMPDRSKMQAFYNDLLEKTNEAVGKLPEHIVTLEDALTQAKVTWRDFLEDLGTAVTRSGVFQGLLITMTEKLNGVNSSMDEQHRMALVVNDSLISLLRTVASAAQSLGYLGTAAEVVSAVIQAAFFLIVGAVVDMGLWVVSVIHNTVENLSLLPGAAGRAFQPVLAWLDQTRNTMKTWQEGAATALTGAFDGIGSSKAKLDGLSDSANKLATDMEKLRGVVLDGADGVKKHGSAAEQAAKDQKELTDQIKTYHDMLFSLQQASATPSEKNMNEYVDQLAKIQKLNQITAEQRLDLQNAAWAKYEAEEKKRLEDDATLQNEAADKRFHEKEQAAQKLMDLDTRLYLETATEEQKAYVKRELDLRAAIAATVEGTEERNRLVMLVEKAYDADMLKVQQDRDRKRQEAERKAIDDAVAAANAILHAVEAVQQGSLSQSDASAMLGNLPKVIDTLKAKLADLRSRPIITDAQLAEVSKLQEALNKLNRMATDGAVTAANAIIHAMEAVQNGTLSKAGASGMLGNLPQVIDTIKAKLAQLKAQPIVSDAQIAEITKLQTALNQLNRVNVGPFKQILNQLKDQMTVIGQQVGTAWGQMWSDLQTDQATAGRKFLGALFQIVAQQLEMMASVQIAKAIAAAAERDYEGAALHTAAAAALGALGGTLAGLGSSISNSANQAPAGQSVGGSGAVTQTNSPTASVGAPGGSRSASSQQAPQQHLIVLELKSNDSHIVNVAANDLANNNGPLRVAVRKATAR